MCVFSATTSDYWPSGWYFSTVPDVMGKSFFIQETLHQGEDMFDLAATVRRVYWDSLDRDRWQTSTREEWLQYIQFDPILARRLYHFPAFVRERARVAKQQAALLELRERGYMLNFRRWPNT